MSAQNKKIIKESIERIDEEGEVEKDDKDKDSNQGKNSIKRRK